MLLKTLGHPALHRADGALAEGLRRKDLALLVYLCVEGLPVHARGRLAALLWGESLEERARHSLTQALGRLSRALPPGIVAPDKDAVRWTGGLPCDAVALLRDALEPEEVDDAFSLYAGHFLEGFDPGAGAQDFREWADRRRAELRNAALRLLERAGAGAEAAGDFARALRLGERAVEIDPVWEQGHRRVMRALAARGERNGALRHYQRLEAYLDEEVGGQPDPDTRTLAEQLRAPLPDPEPAPPPRQAPLAAPPAERVQAAPPGPMQAASPEPVQAAPPGPIQPAPPGPMQAASPEPVQPAPPGPIQAASPEPVQPAPPGPIQAASPEPVQPALPGPIQAAFPAPGEAASPATGPEPAAAPGTETARAAEADRDPPVPVAPPPAPEEVAPAKEAAPQRAFSLVVDRIAVWVAVFLAGMVLALASIIAKERRADPPAPAEPPPAHGENVRLRGQRSIYLAFGETLYEYPDSSTLSACTGWHPDVVREVGGLPPWPSRPLPSVLRHGWMGGHLPVVSDHPQNKTAYVPVGCVLPGVPTPETLDSIFGSGALERMLGVPDSVLQRLPRAFVARGHPLRPAGTLIRGPDGRIRWITYHGGAMDVLHADVLESYCRSPNDAVPVSAAEFAYYKAWTWLRPRPRTCRRRAAHR